MSTSTPTIATTPETLRAALDAKAGLRAGIDSRPGRRVDLRVESRSTNMVVAGRIVPLGTSIVTGVHCDDLHLFTSLVEQASATDLAAVEAEQRRRIAERDEARRTGATLPKAHLHFEGCFRAVTRRDPAPFLSVAIIDGDEPAQPPTKAKR